MVATAESMQLPPLPSLVGMDALPTLPVVAIRLGEIVHSRNVTVQQVAELLRGDPATSAKLLRLVNSPYFGIPGGVADVARAIPFIGFNTLYQLVLGITVLEALGGKDDAVRALWIHSLSVATTARELAVEAKVDPGAAFTAGLLHDMGKIALAKLDPTAFAAATERARAGNLSMNVAEQQLGLPSHDRVGAALAKQWRFPAALAVPIEQHHAIHRAAVRGKLAATLRNLTEVVAGADWLAHAAARTFDGRSETPDEPEALALFERVGLSAAQRQAVMDRSKLALEKSKIFLSVLG
jgi:putative nucleotidyltransferase with HDIG domain